MSRTIAAAVAREQLTDILDDAENGKTTVILRHSRPSAAVVPAADLENYNLFRRIMTEVGETLDISRDPAIIAAVRAAQEEINRGEIVWDEEDVAAALKRARAARRSRVRI
jgi:prevent-host-death family protein